jgi:CHRD domain
MSKLLKLFVALAAAALVLVVAPAAHAQERTTFVTQLSAENEVPGCPAGVESGASGVAVIQIDEVTSEITYRVVATNLPATIEGSPGAHIHVQDPNSPTGPIVVHFERTGLNTGLVAEGTTTDPAVATAILANPENYYVNVHTTVCPAGTIRGQLG